MPAAWISFADVKTLKSIGTDWNSVWPAAEFWARYDKGEFKKWGFSPNVATHPSGQFTPPLNGFRPKTEDSLHSSTSGA